LQDKAAGNAVRRVVASGMGTIYMTCRDQQRLYVSSKKNPVINESKNNSSSSSSSSTLLLGEPMEVLLTRTRRLALQRAQEVETTKAYEPPTQFQMSQLLSDERINRQVLRALMRWNKKNPAKQYENDDSQRLVILQGPTGCGKTVLAETAARHANYEPIHLPAIADTECVVALRRYLCKERLTLRPQCLIVDDAVHSKALVQALIKVGPHFGRPVIVTTTHVYRDWRALIDSARLFHLEAPLHLERRLVSLTGLPATTLRPYCATGDIRAAWYALQTGVVHTKDAGTNLASAVRAVFCDSTNLVQVVQQYGDDDRLWQTCLLNHLHVSYIDPTLDKCATIYEWHVCKHPSVALGALHLLSRIQRPDLQHIQYAGFDRNRQEACRVALSLDHDLASYARHITGTLPLRPVTNVDLYKPHERIVLDNHVDKLLALDLKYVHQADGSWCTSLDLWSLVPQPRLPNALAELLTQAIVQRQWQQRKQRQEERDKETNIEKESNSKMISKEATSNITKEPTTLLVKEATTTTKPQSLPAKKTTLLFANKKNNKPKPGLDFLTQGAQQAKKQQHQKHKGPRLSNTGSRVPLTQVVKLKYVKGFTQAVRKPCRMQDLMRP